MSARFSPGFVLKGRSATEQLDPSDLDSALSRHCRGDWGDVSRNDWLMNDWSVENGDRILSSYTDRNGTKFWILTDAERATTMIFVDGSF
jgi:hypothetical protein